MQKIETLKVARMKWVEGERHGETVVGFRSKEDLIEFMQKVNETIKAVNEIIDLINKTNEKRGLDKAKEREDT